MKEKVKNQKKEISLPQEPEPQEPKEQRPKKRKEIIRNERKK